MITESVRPAHRLAGVRRPDAHYSSRRAPYDAAGNVTTITDPDQNVRIRGRESFCFVGNGGNQGFRN